jgi:hypothetical protein
MSEKSVRLDLEYKGNSDTQQITQEVALGISQEKSWAVRVWAQHKRSLATGAAGIAAAGIAAAGIAASYYF